MTSYRLVFIFVISCCVPSTTVLSAAVGTITMRLYSRNDSYKEVGAEQSRQLVPHINLGVKTLIHCHGFRQSTDSPHVLNLIHNYLAGFDYNIIAADYRHVTLRDDYLSSVYLANEVAEVLVRSINDMVAVGLDKNKLLLTGLSLGAQIAGHIGRILPFKLPEIIAMDPAGPLFKYVEQGITASDALCVKCIHTDMYFYGTSKTCGHLDFYPNGGFGEQPGCPLLPATGACSHDRSAELMGESARNPYGFESVKCNSWSDFKSSRCDRNVIIPMGELSPCSVTGKFYLQTNGKAPFSKGLVGTVYHREL
nr:lipase member H-like isoform X1 [Megalopta genalis]